MCCALLAHSADRSLAPDVQGGTAAAHLDGTLPGDYGFDPLKFGALQDLECVDTLWNRNVNVNFCTFRAPGAEPESLKWMQQAELQHCRWAMVRAGQCLSETAHLAECSPVSRLQS